jgi:biopolymer transport protein TolR
MAFTGRESIVRSEINVTPLVDVVLVLLIIYLVAIPVVLRNLSVDIPNKATIEGPPGVSAQITVEAKEDGTILMDGAMVLRAGLAEKLRARLETRHEKVVFVDFEDKIPYGDAVRLMDTVRGAGAKTVALKLK